MALAPGARLGAYEVVSALGAGGMGEVYRAIDGNLKRHVALKVLPDSFAGDTGRVARFRREAEALAALNHPHIAQIYGLEQTSEVTALAMELVEGEDLSDRIRSGRCRSPRRWVSRGRSPRRSKPRTSAASSIAISSRPTSECAPTAR